MKRNKSNKSNKLYKKINLYNIKNLNNLGDIIAIPFFFLLTIYFYNIPEKSNFEYILFLFSLSGLIADIYFTYRFIKYKRV